MKLLFSVGGKNFFVRVTKDRQMSFRSELTNDKWVAFEELASQPGNNLDEVREATFIVENLVDMKAVEKYIIMEFERKGIIHISTHDV